MVAAPRYAVGQAIEVDWNGQWYESTIRSQDGERYLIHYDGWSDPWDESVRADRMR